MKKILFVLLPLLFAMLNAGDQQMLEIPTIEGKKIHIKGTDNGLEIPEYKGKVVFVEFWGTHCPPCRISIPHYVNLKNEFKDSLQILAIEVQSTPKKMLKLFAKEHGINYDVATYRDSVELVNYISRRAGWQGSIPFLLILDTKGDVVTMQVGLLDEKGLEKLVKGLLARASSEKSDNKRDDKNAGK
jgi:thiol-disulfide isomerase/thioredoxin